MGLFDNLNKKAWKKKLLETTEAILHRIFEYEDYEKHASVKWFNQYGQVVKDDFKGQFMKIINTIANSPTPLYEFRKALFFSTKIDCMHRLLFTDEFNEHREFLLKQMNPDDHQSNSNDEQLSFQSYAFAEAECMVLRHLQAIIFDDVEKKNDWWASYCELVENDFRYLYKLLLEVRDRGIPEVTTAAIVNMSAGLVQQFENRLLGLPDGEPEV